MTAIAYDENIIEELLRKLRRKKPDFFGGSWMDVWPGPPFNIVSVGAPQDHIFDSEDEHDHDDVLAGDKDNKPVVMGDDLLGPGSGGKPNDGSGDGSGPGIRNPNPYGDGGGGAPAQSGTINISDPGDHYVYTGNDPQDETRDPQFGDYNVFGGKDLRWTGDQWVKTSRFNRELAAGTLVDPGSGGGDPGSGDPDPGSGGGGPGSGGGDPGSGGGGPESGGSGPYVPFVYTGKPSEAWREPQFGDYNNFGGDDLRWTGAKWMKTSRFNRELAAGTIVDPHPSSAPVHPGIIAVAKAADEAIVKSGEAPKEVPQGPKQYLYGDEWKLDDGYTFDPRKFDETVEKVTGINREEWSSMGQEDKMDAWEDNIEAYKAANEQASAPAPGESGGGDTGEFFDFNWMADLPIEDIGYRDDAYTFDEDDWVLQKNHVTGHYYYELSDTAPALDVDRAKKDAPTHNSQPTKGIISIFEYNLLEQGHSYNDIKYGAVPQQDTHAAARVLPPGVPQEDLFNPSGANAGAAAGDLTGEMAHTYVGNVYGNPEDEIDPAGVWLHGGGEGLDINTTPVGPRFDPGINADREYNADHN